MHTYIHMHAQRQSYMYTHSLTHAHIILMHSSILEKFEPFVVDTIFHSIKTHAKLKTNGTIGCRDISLVSPAA